MDLEERHRNTEESVLYFIYVYFFIKNKPIKASVIIGRFLSWLRSRIFTFGNFSHNRAKWIDLFPLYTSPDLKMQLVQLNHYDGVYSCLLYTSPSPRDGLLSRMPSSA